MKKRLIALVLVAATALVGLQTWRGHVANAAAQNKAPNESLVSVKKDKIEVNVKGSGPVVASEKRTVKSTVTGTVRKIHAEDGQLVKAGQVIVTLNNDTLQNQYAQAVVELEAARVRLGAAKTATDGDVASAESALKTAEANLEAKSLDASRTRVNSPVSGRVAMVKVNAADPVTPGQVMLTVVNDTDVLVIVQVPQIEIAKVLVGQRATVGFGSDLPGSQGTVYSIGAEAQPGGGAFIDSTVPTATNASVPVSIRVANANGAYRTGLGANATIYVGVNETVSAGGSVAPLARHDMRAEVSGNVKQLYVKEGDTVKSGDALLRIDNTSSDAAVAQARANVKTARENLQRLQSGLAPNTSESDLKSQELRVRQAEIQALGKATDVNALQIKAPIDGTMVSHAVSLGDELNGPAVICTIADFSKMTMIIAVDELDVANVHLGQKAKITLEALPGKTFNAEVTKIAAEGTVKDGVASYDVTLTLTQTEGLRGAMTANASILIKSKENVLVVPAEAVRNEQGVKTVAVARGNGYETVEVMTGVSNGRLTEILSGLSEGDNVLVGAVDRKRINPFTGQEEAGR